MMTMREELLIAMHDFGYTPETIAGLAKLMKDTPKRGQYWKRHQWADEVLSALESLLQEVRELEE